MADQPSPETIFQDALEFSGAEERAAYVREACGGDEPLLREIESLLAVHQAAETFLEPLVTPEPVPSGEQPGDRIGRYKLLELIGEGGFGRVWRAEQTEPVQRRVALKIVKLGMDTGEVLARFEAERQALALMDHPHIARVFDGGATDTGRPYFVMELVRGVPITGYCDANKLPPRARVELFEKVCRAVQHAHQKGIIHRDLKPSNILVTVQDDQPVPKVIDFGVAKALQTRLTERTLFTRFNQWIGTPAYMSPEQAGLSSLDVDVRSDVYSLGTILYELLTGHTPFDQRKLREQGYEAMLRTIREEDPPKPSTRLSSLPREDLNTVADHRGETPEKLGREIRGELDWILLKALERDRSRRYESANSLAAELARFSRGEPVSAVPPGISYQTGKLLKKHWKWASVAAAFVVVLVTGTVVSTRQAFVADRERVDAELAREDAELARQRADDESARRQVQLRETRRQRDRAEWLHYAKQIQLAQREWDAGDAQQARTLLDAAPWNFRGWEYRYLHTLFNSNQRTGQGRKEEPGDVAAGPDGKTQDSTTRQGPLVSKTPRKRAATFTPDDRCVTVGASKENLLIRQNGTADTLIPLPEGVRIDEAVAFSPGGKLVATACFQPGIGPGGHPPAEYLLPLPFDQNVRIWDARTGREIHSLPGPSGHVHGIVFNHDGSIMATAQTEMNVDPERYCSAAITLWDVQTGRAIHTLREPSHHMFCVAFSADGSLLAGAAGDLKGPCEVKIWDARTGRVMRSFPGPPDAVYCVAFNPDATLLAAGSHCINDSTRPGEVRVWNIGTGRQVLTLRGHTGPVNCVTFSPDGTRLVSGSDDETVRIWNATTGFEALTLRGHARDVTEVSFSPTGTRLASTARYGTVRVWDATSAPEARLLHGNTGGVSTLSFDRSGRRLASGSFQSTVHIWDTRTGSEGVTATIPGPPLAVLSACFSPNDSLLATANGGRFGHQVLGGGVTLWDPETGRETRTLWSSDTGWAWDVCFSPDGTRLAASVTDEKLALDQSLRELWVRVWEPRTGEELLRLEQSAGVTRLAFSPDGRHLAGVGTGTRTEWPITLWNAETGRLTWTIKAHASNIWGITFSPDGRRLASCSDDRTAKVWDVATGEEMLTLGGNTDRVAHVFYTPDGARLFTYSREIRVWDAKTGKLIHRIDGNIERPVHVSPVAVSPDFRLLAACDKRGRIKVWNIRETIERSERRREEQLRRQREASETDLETTRKLLAADLRSGDSAAGRYVKLVVEKADGTNHACIAELNFMDSEGNLIPQDELSIHEYSSFQHVAPEAPYPVEAPRLPNNVLDGDPSTFWHSQWFPEPAKPFPHWVIIDLGKPRELGGFLLKNRADKRQVDTLSWRLSISDDAESWKELAAGGFEKTANWQGHVFGMKTN